MSEHKIDEETGVETTGHSWDNIEELNNPLPRWWLWTFYGTIAWGVLYTIFFPAWPLITQSTGGLLGFSTRGQVVDDIATYEAANAELNTALATVELASLSVENPDLHRYAVASGASIFRNHCSQCHGSGAAGGIGYPNLLDDNWLWGGDHEAIAYTVRHGIRNEADPDARWSQMPAFGDVLENDEIAAVVEHVKAISGQEHDESLLEVGAVIYDEQCSSCHGVEGKGDHEIGAPNLTDAIWLYGGDDAALTYTVVNARFGVMPNWSPRLSDAEVNAVAAYVHQLGGGETAE
ncbi:cytochrome-c oxidase, cbb3-type subunit III [Actibacterium sp. 188UL27-1]|uniref:cytochrome-c oxidase, cbb3-type subunit III n=1 Tax=Actibacterium sp. 188UL27-1 TaxID=2786961 RepID=UPI00195E2ED2|nr:cytochrome-c oxidase, cbb3-type subunit III [Actibacterium sp. 188UL27-1]MBM7068779.1 cytochrome-c oxidase, cbb3-type subunit III [Actibacterium sp. 188UL27-1]